MKDALKILEILVEQIESNNNTSRELDSILNSAKSVIEIHKEKIKEENEKIFRFAYSSWLLCSENELYQISLKSELKNKQKNISGVLVYNSTFLIQILEGSEAEINSLVEIIRNDKRHKNFKVLCKSHNVQRLFSKWSMSSREADKEVFSEIIKKLKQINELKYVIADIEIGVKPFQPPTRIVKNI